MRRGRERAAAAGAAALAGVVAYDLVQRRHAILRNFPIIGHFRYLLEEVGPELRQYIVTSNNEERPFSRDERSWVYASSKQRISTIGFGSDNEMELTSGYFIVKPAPRPWPRPVRGSPGGPPEHLIPCGKVLGAAHGRRHAFRPGSVVNISGMSFGALSANAVEALNRGAAGAPCLHNTGEGGLAPHHLHGADLIFQIGTGYFGCRDRDGRFSLEQLRERIAAGPIRALEIKLSQGAKPGVGGLVPAAKMTPEIARIRGVEPGRDCLSPATHSAFDGVEGLVEFVELLASETGLPVGIKSAVGQQRFWDDLVRVMDATGGGPDFVTIDGGEGGTGAAPLAFADHVSLPFKLGFSRVFATFAQAGLTEDVVFIGSAKLGLPAAALFAFGLGADMVNVGREALMSVGCIQSQRCHTGRCPTGVATQNRWLVGGLDPASKSERCATYVRALRGELLALTSTCGVPHPTLVTPDMLELLDEGFTATTAEERFGYFPAWRSVPDARRAEIEGLFA
ncbi:MAG TPA: FMN-binding glutamate synthase family protein [Solirubrobacteraceae bacterium]|nr:FMN-binding glutamate synthase family protein [Solirubrobacteraceae bacterium]